MTPTERQEAVDKLNEEKIYSQKDMAIREWNCFGYGILFGLGLLFIILLLTNSFK